MKNYRAVEAALLVGLSVVILITGCSDIREIETERVPGTDRAVCLLTPTEGNSARGVVIFTETDEGVEITARMEGLAPGKHGFHIHQYGDLRSAGATSAGGHYNPGGDRHGAPSDPERHTGDLGNLDAGSDSTAHYQRTDTVISLDGPHSIVGRAVIVHAGEDDFTTQPTGDAGPRIAAGVIGIGNPDYTK